MTTRETPFRASPVKGSGRQFAVRFSDDETKALEQIAIQEDRSLASLCRRVIREWLRQQSEMSNITKKPT